jgi:hypothetical protein
MDERTWQLFTKAAKAASSRDQRRHRDMGSRSEPFEIDLDDGHGSCHPTPATTTEANI